MLIFDNPFYLLKANPKDNRKDLLELADEAAFEIDSIKSNESRSILSNPRKRLEAEFSFFLGTTNIQNKKLFNVLINKNDLNNLKNIWELNSLSYANLLANLIDNNNSDFENIYLIRLLINTFNDFDLNEIKLLINEDRKISGFPEVENNKDIEEQINARKLFYLNCIKKYTSQLNLNVFSSLLISFIEESKANKEPILLSVLIDSFELQFKQYVLNEEEKVTRIIEKIKTMTSSEYNKSSLKDLVLLLNKELREWDKLVQPIQLSTQKRGLEHIQSKNLGIKVRNIALDLQNMHSETDLAHLITLNLMDVFKEVTTLSDLSRKDSQALKTLLEKDEIMSKLSIIGKFAAIAKVNSDSTPHTSLKRAEIFISKSSPVLKDIKENYEDGFYRIASNQVARCLNSLAVNYGNSTEKYQESISLLDKALSYATDNDVTEIINKNISIYKQNLGHPLYKERPNTKTYKNERNSASSKSSSNFIWIFIIFITLPFWIYFWWLTIMILIIWWLSRNNK